MNRRELLEDTRNALGLAVCPTVSTSSVSKDATQAVENSRTEELQALKRTIHTHNLNGFFGPELEGYMDTLASVDEETYNNAIQKGISVDGKPQVTIQYNKANPHVANGQFTINTVTFTQDKAYSRVEIQTDYTAPIGILPTRLSEDLYFATRSMFYNMFHNPKVIPNTAEKRIDAFSYSIPEKIEAGDFAIRAGFSPVDGRAVFSQYLRLPDSQ